MCALGATSQERANPPHIEWNLGYGQMRESHIVTPSGTWRHVELAVGQRGALVHVAQSGGSQHERCETIRFKATATVYLADQCSVTMRWSR
jgi:hypothetical protein